MKQDSTPLEKLPLLSVVREMMIGAGFELNPVNGGIMTRVTAWLDTAVVFDMDSCPVRVMPSPTRRVSGGEVIESIVLVLLAGILMVKLEIVGAENMVPSEERALMT